MKPIYRAKKINEDEWVEGYLTEDIIGDGTIVIQTTPLTNIGHINVFGFETIDPSTLAIHFPNMIDKNGKKIFASLSEDGVGGDVVIFEGNFWRVHFSAYRGMMCSKLDGTMSNWECSTWHKFFEVTGIHK